MRPSLSICAALCISLVLFSYSPPVTAQSGFYETGEPWCKIEWNKGTRMSPRFSSNGVWNTPNHTGSFRVIENQIRVSFETIDSPDVTILSNGRIVTSDGTRVGKTKRNCAATVISYFE